MQGSKCEHFSCSLLPSRIKICHIRVMSSWRQHAVALEIINSFPIVMIARHQGAPSVQALLDSGSLPSAWGTRQRPNCTWQSLCRVRHSAKNTWQKIDQQRPLCQVSFIGHSTKALPRAPGYSAKKSDCHGAGPVDGGFAECQPCRHSAKIFIFFKKFLCRVASLQALGKDFLFF